MLENHHDVPSSPRGRSRSRGRFLRSSLLATVVAVGATAALAGCSLKQDSGNGSGSGSGSAAGAAAVDSDYAQAVSKLVDGRTIKVGFTPPILSEMFSQMESSAFQRMAELEEAYGVKWEWERSAPTGNFDSVEQQIKIVQGWGSRGFDAILVCTGANFATMQGVYDQVEKEGSKVFQFNQPVELYPVDKIKTVSNVGYDNRWQSGYLAGKYLADTLGGKGKILQIWGPSGSDWSRSRQIGFDAALKEHPGLEVVGKADGGYVRDKGFTAAQDLLTRDKDVNAIYGENEDMALGASQAIDALGLKHWDGKSGIVTIGADGLISGMEAIRAGKLTATVDVGSVDQGRAFIDAIFASVVLGESVDKVINIPTRVVTEDNVDAAQAYIKAALNPQKKY
jgi:ABC-type sugar transport system substrate-binding protein